MGHGRGFGARAPCEFSVVVNICVLRLGARVPRGIMTWKAPPLTCEDEGGLRVRAGVEG